MHQTGDRCIGVYDFGKLKVAAKIMLKKPDGFDIVYVKGVEVECKTLELNKDLKSAILEADGEQNHHCTVFNSSLHIFDSSLHKLVITAP